MIGLKTPFSGSIQPATQFPNAVTFPTMHASNKSTDWSETGGKRIHGIRCCHCRRRTRGLATAIKLSQLALEADAEISICLVEKGSEIGAHILSGAVVEPTALNELFPDWQAMGAPLTNPVTDDDVYMLVDEKQSMRLPSLFIPSALHNEAIMQRVLATCAGGLESKLRSSGSTFSQGSPRQRSLSRRWLR